MADHDSSAHLHPPARCQSCGETRVLCAFSVCLACHALARPAESRPETPLPVLLCCGWWGTPTGDPWLCPTCRRVRLA